MKEGEVAKSLICNECGRRLRSHQQAEFHASKTSHVDFSESVEEIAPLTEDEKKGQTRISLVCSLSFADTPQLGWKS